MSNMTATDFESLTLDECANRLLGIENPLVLMHVRPDGDTVGSGAALCRIFEALGKHPRFACPDPIPKRLAFLTEGLELAISPETRDPLCDISSLTAVSIDVPSLPQLGFIGELLEVTLTIDHHQVNRPYAPNYTVGGASSAGEVLLGVARRLESLGKIKIDKSIATPIYAAMVSDTGGFAYSSANPDTYRRAAELIELGVDHPDIYRRLFSSKSREQIRAEGYVAERMLTAAGGRIAYFTLSLEERESLGLDHTHFETAIDVVRSLFGCEIAVTVKEAEAGVFRASIRSTSKNVAEIAARHSGGGHALAAGCSPVGESVLDAAEALLTDLIPLVSD